MNLPWSSGPRGPLRATALCLAAVVLAGCNSSTRTAKAGAKATATLDQTAQHDARPLARELLDLMDQTMSYASSHRGNLPPSLRRLGVDSLTATTARYLQITDGTPLIVVVYRDPRGHAVTSCRGTDEILEQSMLREGRIDVVCTRPTGEGVPISLSLQDGG